jgi:hypothetical protein
MKPTMKPATSTAVRIANIMMMAQEFLRVQSHEWQAAQYGLNISVQTSPIIHVQTSELEPSNMILK